MFLINAFTNAIIFVVFDLVGFCYLHNTSTNAIISMVLFLTMWVYVILHNAFANAFSNAFGTQVQELLGIMPPGRAGMAAYGGQHLNQQTGMPGMGGARDPAIGRLSVLATTFPDDSRSFGVFVLFWFGFLISTNSFCISEGSTLFSVQIILIFSVRVVFAISTCLAPAPPAPPICWHEVI